MSNAAEAGPSGESGPGRGEGAPGRGEGGPGRGSKKVKFTPKVPTRRKKNDTSELGGVTAADAAAVNEEFKDLIKAAETGSTWQRGRGRGRGGPGGRGGAQQQAFQVTFGGSTTDRPSLPDAKVVRHYAAGTGGGGAAGSRVPGAPKVKAEVKPGAEPGVKEDEDEDTDVDMAEHMVLRPEKRFAISEALDYSQYYPTTLPLQVPGSAPDYPEDHTGPPVPKDLAITPDIVTNAAADLGLLNLDEQEPPLFLVQLPAVLPISTASRAAALAAASAAADAAAAGGSAAPGAGSAPGSSAAGAGPSSRQQAGASSRAPGAAPTAAESRGCNVKELPSGQIGRLLVFKSGKVKLQMGDVVMDVSPGLPCQHRMDVAAINCQAGHCVLLGDIHHRMVVSPDIWQLMDENAKVPDFRVGKAGDAGAKGANGSGTAAMDVATDGEAGEDGAAEKMVEGTEEEEEIEAEDEGYED